MRQSDGISVFCHFHRNTGLERKTENPLRYNEIAGFFGQIA